MKPEKLCPFNNMSPCIKKQCALYMPDVAVATAKGKKISIDVEETMLVSRCAIAVTGASTLLLCASDSLEGALRDQQEDNISADG